MWNNFFLSVWKLMWLAAHQSSMKILRDWYLYYCFDNNVLNEYFEDIQIAEISVNIYSQRDE